MAFDANNSRFLLWLISRGEKLGNMLTIGRLGVFLPEGSFESDANRFAIRTPSSGWGSVLKAPYCDPILSALGAESVSSLDFSAYEGADVIHDLNTPIPDELHENYDLLFDSGSLEHVFNVPVALQNYVNLVRKGGLLVLDLPVDGCSGHGFFQFSPELFYRYFSAETGCRVEAMFCVENLPDSKWYRVPDPAEIKRRVEIDSSRPIHLLILIRRVEILDSVSKHHPSQADYEVAWDGHKSGQVERANDAGKRFGHGISGVLRNNLIKLLGIGYHRFSVSRNAKRERRDFQLRRSPYLDRFDPFPGKIGDK